MHFLLLEVAGSVSSQHCAKHLVDWNPVTLVPNYVNYSLALPKEKSVCPFLSLSFSYFVSLILPLSLGEFTHTKAGQPFVVLSHTQHAEASADGPLGLPVRSKSFRTLSEIPSLPCLGRTRIVHHQNIVMFSFLNWPILTYISHCCSFVILYSHALLGFFPPWEYLENQIKIFNWCLPFRFLSL